MKRLAGLLLLLPLGVGAAEYWVDISGTGTGAKDGSDADNLCAGLADPDCPEGAGDTVYLCGTAGSLNLPASGADGNKLIYDLETCGATIDGTEATQGYGVLINGSDYLTVRGPVIDRAGGDSTGTVGAIRIQPGSTDIEIDGATITNTGDDNGQAAYDIYAYVTTDAAGGLADIDIHDITHDGTATRCVSLAYFIGGNATIIDGFRYADSYCPGNRKSSGAAFWIAYSEASDQLAGRRTLGLDIDGNTFTNTSTAAIATTGAMGTGADQSYVRNNTLTNIGATDWDLLNAIQTHHNDDLIIEYNVIDGINDLEVGDGSAIIIDWDNNGDSDYISSGVIVRYNTCINITPESDAGKCVNVFAGENTQVYGNVAWNCKYGVKLSQTVSTGTVAYNNTFMCELPWWSGFDAQAATVKNNIFVSTGENSVYMNSGVVAPTLTNNVYWGYSGDAISENGTPVAVDATSEEADPLFVGGSSPTTAEGFRLRADSPARYAGTYLGPMQDYGNRRFKVTPSIGAYESASGDLAGERTVRD